jgi:hypothetical protein
MFEIILRGLSISLIQHIATDTTFNHSDSTTTCGYVQSHKVSHYVQVVMLESNKVVL